MKKLILFTALIISHISWACRGGNEMMIEDINGQQIGMIKKADLTEFLPDVDKGFYIGEVEICSSAPYTPCTRLQKFGKARKQLLINRAALLPTQTIIFEMLDAKFNVIAKYEISSKDLFVVARGSGCGGTLSPVQN